MEEFQKRELESRADLERAIAFLVKIFSSSLIIVTIAVIAFIVSSIVFMFLGLDLAIRYLPNPTPY